MKIKTVKVQDGQELYLEYIPDKEYELLPLPHKNTIHVGGYLDLQDTQLPKLPKDSLSIRGDLDPQSETWGFGTSEERTVYTIDVGNVPPEDISYIIDKVKNAFTFDIEENSNNIKKLKKQLNNEAFVGWGMEFKMTKEANPFIQIPILDKKPKYKNGTLTVKVSSYIDDLIELIQTLKLVSNTEFVLSLSGVYQEDGSFYNKVDLDPIWVKIIDANINNNKAKTPTITLTFQILN